MAHGPGSMVIGPWSTVRGPWYVVHGPWSMVHGTWSMVYGPWSMVHGWVGCVAVGGVKYMLNIFGNTWVSSSYFTHTGPDV